MTGPISQVPLNLTTADPELADVLDLFKRDIFLSLNCHQIGVVQAFDPALQRATVSIPYKKTFYEKSPTDGTYNPVLVDYPLLLECPVVVMGGGGGLLTFPVTNGDECLVLFNDRDLDNWAQGQTGTGVASARSHNFADGLVLVGVRSVPNAVTGYNPNSTELRNKAGTVKVVVDDSAASLNNGPTKVSTGPTKVTITNGTTTLGSVLTSLVTALQTFSASTASASSFANVDAAGSALGTALTTLATQLSGLLA